jgi:polyhydroxyalkanoate synthesis regulator phasin
MTNRIIRTTCVVLAVAALAMGSVAVAASDRSEKAPPNAPPPAERTPKPEGTRQLTLEDITARILQMENRNRVEAVLARLVESGRITQGEASQILNAWDEAHPNWRTPIERLAARLMEVQNRNRVEAILDRAVAANFISQDEANQILKDWDETHPEWQSPLERLTARIMEMQNRSRVEAVLDRLVEAGKITQGDANKILEAWDEAHPNWQPPAPSTRIGRA